MIVPALIFTVLNAGTSGSKGWGIPMATDIAIVTGVVALLGTRAPSWLKLFLLALAIADDIGAIVVIAIFYSEGVSIGWLAAAVATLVVASALRNRVDQVGVYLVLGTLCWLALYEAHVHTTLTGVAFGMLAPVTPRLATGLVDVDELARVSTVDDAVRASRRAQYSVSVVEWLEHRLHPWSAFVVVPLFALANAGIHIPTGGLGEAMSERVTWGVILGLVIGKTVGITGATLLAVALKVGRLPAGRHVSIRHRCRRTRRDRLHGVVVRHRSGVRRGSARHRRPTRGTRGFIDRRPHRHCDLSTGTSRGRGGHNSVTTPASGRVLAPVSIANR